MGLPEHPPVHANISACLSCPSTGALLSGVGRGEGESLCLGYLLGAVECVVAEIQTPAGFPAAGAASSQG